ncbi:MAG: FAD-binding protein [Flavobacteriia bacterium]|nr:FAD-binding protein [Flavobacteriia bacterium]
MPLEISFSILPEFISDNDYIKNLISVKTKWDKESFYFKWKKRSIDARSKQITFFSTFLVYKNEENYQVKEFVWKSTAKKNSEKIHIIGAGPSGLFAALQALQLGLVPIIYERGKDVRSRRRDIALLNQKGIVNPESNYCFGEGGAGTYSDGKLYTRSKKRGDTQNVLELFVLFGADKDILVNTHPHIGTNKLPHVIVKIREFIQQNGGEIHFESKLTDLFIKNNCLYSFEINSQQKISCKNLILATGHSARDVYYLLHQKKIKIQAKSFALGVRIEHPQTLIDEIQYHSCKNDYLPPASYSLVTQVNKRGVYSFCMCPGGIIAPCATDINEVVTNGWSPSKRNNPYANSGIVVSVFPEDFEHHKTDPLVCLEFQKKIETLCWEFAGKNQKVPAQRIMDFIHSKKSLDLPKTSYQPGIVSVDLNSIFPPFISNSLKEGLKEFGKKMKGFLSEEAVLHAPESRTSSPIQIPRNKETFEHIEIKGLYPCAEGAGYAGGIVSAAIDGMNCVKAIVEKKSLKFD